MNELRTLLRPALLHVAALSFVANLLLLAPALFMLQVYDRVLASQSRETLLVLLIGMAVALGLMLALDYLRARLQGVIGNIAAEALTPAVTRIAVAQGARRSGAGSAEGLADVAALRALFSTQGLLAVFDAPWIVIYIAVIWVAHPTLGATAFGAALAMLGMAVLTDRMTRASLEAAQKANAAATRYLEASLHNAEVAQALGMTEALIARWRSKTASTASLQRPTATRLAALSAFTRTLRQALQVLILATASYLVIRGEATPGVMIAATILLGRALAPVELAVGSWRVLAAARAAYRRIAELLAGAAAEPKRMALPAPHGRLVAQNLVYRAPGGERLLLAGISLELEPGQSLAVIGASGAGKSTLLRLLTGVWHPAGGIVRLDQSDLGQWPREEIGPFIGYVPQDVELFAGTVAENIARLAEVDAAKVVKAAERAHAHDMILTLRNGYDTLIEPKGAAVSPGQRQRIALARALYGEPKLLLLDEPNSNLDGAGEAALADTLRALRGEVTVVVVTHRSTLVQHADKLLVLDGGKAAHYGSTREVLAAMRQKTDGAGAQVVAMPRPVHAHAGPEKLS